MKKFNFLVPHIIVAIGFLILAFIYAKPVLDKKVLSQHDIIQSQGAAQEILNYEKETGEYSLWTNSMFSGMPSYTVVGRYPNSWTSNLAGYITYIFPEPVNVIFFLLIGFYIMMSVLGFNPWLSVLGSIGFAFSSYNFISLEAGHISKVLAIAYAPPLIAATILIFRGRYFIGSIILSIFTFLELYSNHIQITYYLFIALFVYAIFELVISVKENRVKQYFIASIIIVGIIGASIASMASRFWTTYEYSQQTIRGASELKTNTESKGGLDKDYAYSWSYGVGETFTFLIPNFYGGKSQGSLDKDSETFKTIKKYYGTPAAKNFVENEGLPLYWGAQPNTGGPAYLGAIVFFLFVFALLVVKNPLKWWILSVVILFTVLSWGKNFNLLTDFFFYHVPLYNKFRAVTMIHALVSMLMSFMAMWGIKVIIENPGRNEEFIKKLKYTAGTFASFLLILVVMGGSLFNFEKKTSDAIQDYLPFSSQKESVKDLKDQKKDDEEASPDQFFVQNLERMTNDKKVAGEIYDSILEDRGALMTSDALRSLIFVVLAAAVLWIYFTKNIDCRILYSVLAILVLIDLWPVCKRYLNNDDFMPKKKYQAQFQPSEADKTILEDKDPDFRVMNRTVSTFNDATTSYFHKSIGGYSAAKMRRYQDIIEKHISEGNMAVINMLNTKYVIQDADNRKIAYRNPDALGNAWFVKEYKMVNNADEEINGLKGFNPKNTAIIDKLFNDKVGKLNIVEDSLATIKLTSYKPNHLTYESVTGSDQLAVFSEIYYNDGLGWEAYLDGKPTSHFRVDYILRGMIVPAGKHTIEFKFHPQSYFTGEKISLVFSILIFAGIIGLTFIKIKKNKQEDFDLN